MKKEYTDTLQSLVLFVCEKAAVFTRSLFLHFRHPFPKAQYVVLSAAAVLSIFVGSLVVSDTAYAANKYDDMSPADKALSIWYYHALKSCFQNHDSGGAISNGGTDNGDYFAKGVAKNTTVKGAVIGNSLPNSDKDFNYGCKENDSEMVRKAFSLWDIDSRTFLCESGIAKDDSYTGQACMTSPLMDYEDGKSERAEKYDNYVRSQVFGGKLPTTVSAAGPEVAYVYNLRTFDNACATGKNTSGNGVKIVRRQADGVSKSEVYYDIVKNKSIPYSNTVDMTCANLAATLAPNSGLVNGYFAWAEGEVKSGRGSIVSEDVGPLEDGESGEDGPTCVVNLIGWIVCPVVTFLADVADEAYSFLSNQFLEVPASFFDRSSDAGKQLHSVWSSFLGFANAALVIVFIVIIYSHITGVGISTLNLKRMVPRLVIVAILVNLSYYICTIAIDLSNILGYAIKGVFDTVGATTSVSDNETTWASTGFGGWGQLATVLMVGSVAVISLGVVGLISVLIPAVIALIMIFFILTLRQALIVLLVVVAPLAFVAYILPNTEQWFKRWRKTFTAVLLVFPTIGLVFGASALASQVMGYTVGQNDQIGQIAAAAVMVLPLFVVPSLLKKSLDSVGSLGGKLSGFGDKMGSRAKSGFDNSGAVKYKKEQDALKRAKVSAGVYKGKGPVSNLRSRGSSLFNKSRLSGGYGNQRSLAASKLIAAEDKEHMETSRQWLVDQGVDDSDKAMAIATGGDAYSTYQRRASLEFLSNKMTPEQTEKLAESAHLVTDQKERKALTDSVASMKGSVPYMATGKMMGKMEKGEAINAEAQRVEWAANGSSGEALAGAHEDAIKRVVESSQNNPAAMAGLSRARADLEASPSASKVTAGAQKQINKIPLPSGTPTQPQQNNNKNSSASSNDNAPANPPADDPPDNPPPAAHAPAKPTTTLNGQEFEQRDSGLFVPRDGK